MATARIACHLATPKSPKEHREKLTEYVNVIAFTPRNRHLLMSCSKGQLIAVMGGVSIELSILPNGDERIERTIIAEDICAAAASVQPKGVHPADMDTALKSRINEAADLMPEEAEGDGGFPPALD